MPPLNKFQRNLLEAAVVKARHLAEDGARAVLGYLGVTEASAPSYLNEGQQDLRQRLKVHGLQLGDVENNDKTQKLDLLVEEIAYEHWHRMLFAKFLAENNLLVYTGQGSAVPVTLEECAELAQGEGAADGWELAARCAAGMLPQIFRTGSPVFDVVLPPESRQGLEKEI
ncbi:MAG: SAM-dependent DNA methyltransferase, partial [Deltaproteobacteria bacterium]|nr:SAM-dependent DNA methyltransferase [Deltaproteobacteria bacterium]